MHMRANNTWKETARAAGHDFPIAAKSISLRKDAHLCAAASAREKRHIDAAAAFGVGKMPYF